MRTERDAVFGDASQTFEAHHLIPAAVGKDGAPPGHEAMQATRLANDLVSGPQIEVIGVGKKNLDAQPLEFFLSDSLDAARRTYRHEGARLYHAVGGAKEPGAGPRTRIARHQIKFQTAFHHMADWSDLGTPFAGGYEHAAKHAREATEPARRRRLRSQRRKSHLDQNPDNPDGQEYQEHGCRFDFSSGGARIADSKHSHEPEGHDVD